MSAQPPAPQDEQPETVSPAPHPAAKKLPIPAIIAITAAIGLVVGLAGGLGGMYLYTNPIINQQQSDIQDLNTSLDSVKAQLADANEKLNPQEDPNDTGSNTDASGTGETAAGQPFIPSVDAVMDDVYADAVTRAMRKEERARSAEAKRIESVNDEQSRVAETLSKLHRGDLDIAAYEDEHKFDGDGDDPA